MTHTTTTATAAPLDVSEAYAETIRHLFASNPAGVRARVNDLYTLHHDGTVDAWPVGDLVDWALDNDLPDGVDAAVFRDEFTARYVDTGDGWTRRGTN